jgi:hypothetical protein
MAEERDVIERTSADEELPAEADQIKEQIEETRNQMGETIDAIQERLSIANISEQVSEHVNQAVENAKVALYDATVGRAATFMKQVGNELGNSNVIGTIKSNPLPYILLGAGAGLLIYQGYSGKGRSSRGRTNGGPRSLASAAESSEGRGGGVTGTISSAAGNAYGKVTGAVGGAYNEAGEYVSQAYNKVGELGSTVREQYDHYVEAKPLALGAVALGLGVAVGLAIPSTQYESELLGDARQNLLDKAQDTAAGLIDRTKQMVTEAGQAITDQADSVMEH